jgi:hypothetical protein
MEKKMTVQLDRLSRMADMIEREMLRGHYEFDLGEWGCGTTACAIGLAVATREFEAEGFKSYSPHCLARGAEAGYLPIYQDYDGWEAIQIFFGIDGKTSHYFFSLTDYSIGSKRGPEVAKKVIARLRDFVVKSKQPKIVEPQRVLEPA